MERPLEEIYSSQAELIRDVVLEFSDVQSAHLCYLFIKDSGHIFNNLQQIEKQVSLKLHIASVPELLGDLNLTENGEEFWILQNLENLRLTTHRTHNLK